MPPDGTTRHASEFRQDPVTGDWVVVATGRARRPNEYARREAKRRREPKAGCPFERLAAEAITVYDRRGRAHHEMGDNRSRLAREWWLEVLPNKYPAFTPGACPSPVPFGPYNWQDGMGFHEVVVTRDHRRTLGEMTSSEAAIVLRSYRGRYLALRDEGCVRYISIFHNHGPSAGASIAHPHSQIIAIPAIPPDVARSLHGSQDYFEKNRQCVHCTMLAFERREGWRIVYENEHAIAFCPYVSRSAFEIRIFPKRHAPEFELVSEAELAAAAEALRIALAKLARGVGDPDYNFFIHTAPTADGERTPYYHWHIEIIPKTAVWAGFEIGTGIEISTISPEGAAAYLRKIRVS